MSDEKKQVFTFISRCAPYGSDRPAICLDLALATTVFDQPVNFVFLGDGVLQLLTDQNSDPIGMKNLGATLESLDLYGINKVFVDSASLSDRNLTTDDLLIEADTIDGERLQSLLDQSDVVFNL